MEVGVTCSVGVTSLVGIGVLDGNGSVGVGDPVGVMLISGKSTATSVPLTMMPICGFSAD